MQRAAMRCDAVQAGVEAAIRSGDEVNLLTNAGVRQHFPSGERKNGICLHRPYEIDDECIEDQTGRACSIRMRSCSIEVIS
jgi:hypothetical protein